VDIFEANAGVALNTEVPRSRLADFKRVRRVSALNEFTIAAVIVNAHQTEQSACHRDLTRVTVTPWQICCRKICHK
jgi:hypothetical protein